MEKESSIAIADRVGVVIFLTTVGVGLLMLLGDSLPPVIGTLVVVSILVLASHFLAPTARALLRARRWLRLYVLAHERVAGFLVPNNVSFHPGHAWAKLERKDIITVGMDDFAVKLLGSVDSISLPEEGSKVKQGFPGWLMKADGRAIEMLSPVDGEVVAVNDAVANSPGVAFEDPYGNGWLFKVKCNNWISNLNNMIIRDKVGEWLEDIRDNLASRRLAPALAPLCADGGEAIRGMAKAVDPEGWDDLAREFFLMRAAAKA